MSSKSHSCNLPENDQSGLPRLHPNAPCHQRLLRAFRKFTSLSYNNAKCQEFFPNKSAQVAEAKRHASSPYFYVIHPFSNCNALIEVLFFLTWSYSLILNPIETFHCDTHRHLVHTIIDDYIVLYIQRGLILVFFFVGYVDDAHKEIILRPQKIILNYITSYFVIDTIAAELTMYPLELILQRLLSNESMVLLNFIRHIFVMAAFYVRFNSLLRYLQGITQHMMLPKPVQSIIVHFLRTFLVVHICACMGFAIPQAIYMGQFPKESWITQSGLDTSCDVPKKYFECFLLTACYFFGASHGMYDVTVPNEQLCLSIITFAGRLYTLFLLADLLRVIGIANVSESLYQQRVNHLEEYMISKNLPTSLRKRCLNYFERKLRKRCFNEKEIYATISEHIKTDLFMHAARNLVKRVFLFKALSQETLSRLIAVMRMETFAPKDVIIKVGETVTDIYFISSGTVAVFSKTGFELCHLEDSDEFGIISNFTNIKQPYQIEAIETTEVFFVNKEIFIDILKEHTDIIRQMNLLAERRMAKLEAVQMRLSRGGTDFLSDLRNGKILETFKRKLTVAE